MPKTAKKVAKKVVKAKANPVVGGKIFVMMVRGTLVLKLPKVRVDELVEAGKGAHFDPGHGRLMKEWLALAGSKPPWLELSREAYRFVKGVAR